MLVRLSGFGTTAKFNTAVWAVDSTGKLRELLRAGDNIGKVVAKIELLNAPRGAFGVTRSFNTNGAITLLATFTDRSQALIRLDVP
jgi:hypothetical protein